MSLVLEGHDLQPAHKRWRFWVAEGRDELPDVRSSSEVIPFRRGRLHKPGIADKRDLEIRGYIKETTDAAMRAELDLIKQLLDPETEVPSTLEDDFEDGSRRWIRVLPRNIIPRYGGKGTRLLSIDVEALDPYWYEQTGISMDAGYAMDAGEVMDSGEEIIVVPTSTSFEVILDTRGTARVEHLRISFFGPSTTPCGIENVSTGELVGFAFDFKLNGSDDSLIGDNDERTAVLAGDFLVVGGQNARSHMTLRDGNRHGEYLHLLPGPNTLRILGKPASCRIRFLPTYN